MLKKTICIVLALVTVLSLLSALSFSANALGLTNAATPIGLRVMQELQEQNKDKKTASNAMCMFLAMNTAGFQIIPATVIAVLVAVGSKNPTEIIIPTMIVTTIAFCSSVVVAKIFQKLWKPQAERSEDKYSLSFCVACYHYSCFDYGNNQKGTYL